MPNGEWLSGLCVDEGFSHWGMAWGMVGSVSCTQPNGSIHSSLSFTLTQTPRLGAKWHRKVQQITEKHQEMAHSWMTIHITHSSTELYSSCPISPMLWAPCSRPAAAHRDVVDAAGTVLCPQPPRDMVALGTAMLWICAPSRQN